ncbi:hypothetical protein [Sodalis sp.]|uniref:hypothetical protein n=1 Tax=Sodalis sp. (in: enterobacteria) TaxID=1898979 RepID=UPI003872CED8
MVSVLGVSIGSLLAGAVLAEMSFTVRGFVEADLRCVHRDDGRLPAPTGRYCWDW